MQRPWPAFLRAIIVNTPLLAFLLYYRLTAEVRYVSYRVPLLGDFPKGFLFDLLLVLVALLVWSLAAQRRWARALYIVVMAPVMTFVVLFRAVDHYYYASTRVPLNIYVLYGNLGFVQEGTGVVLRAPFCLILVLAVGVHYLLYAWSPAYAGWWRRVAELSSHRRLLVLSVSAATLLLLAINGHALLVHPKRRDVVRSFTGEYDLLAMLPRFLREEGRGSKAQVRRPAQLYLPDSVPMAARSAGLRARRPDIFLVTVESFNYLYAEPPRELNPALSEELMPFFKSMAKEGLFFTSAYTSSAYTFNGITSVLCSQYTMSESVWGHDCLPELLSRNGYDAFSFVSINQLRPYRYDNFRKLGFDRSRTFDAVKMRAGKRNVFFEFLLDRELFENAADLADSVSRLPGRKPMFVHVATNQMHTPGYFNPATCSPYAFPPSLAIDSRSRHMLGAAHCTDQDLEAFITRLKRSGLYDDALIIITADHAFNVTFWDHQESELARIPLLLKFPKADRPSPVDTAQVTAQVDIAPTLIDYLGLQTDRPMYGRSLLEASSVPRRGVAGISISHLLSMASESGLVFHVHGQHDLEDRELREELDALFDTVLYFDQNPGEFQPAFSNPDQSGRWRHRR